MNTTLNYLLTSLLLGGLALVGSAWIFARWWCKPKRTASQKTPAAYGLNGERVHFYSHGVALKGWLIPGKPGSGPWPSIVMMHGWSRSSAELFPLAARLNDSGFAILLFDARGHGESGDDGPITINKFCEDILAGLDYLGARPDMDIHRLGLFGRSLGGSSAILAAAQDARIGALVSCSAFSDPRPLTSDTLRMLHLPAWPLTDLVCYFIETWLQTSMKNVAPVNRIPEVAAPILLVHGELDRYIGAQNLDILFNQAPRASTERYLVAGRGHSDVLRDPACQTKIIDFFVSRL